MTPLDYKRLAEAVMQSKDDMLTAWDWLSKRIMPRQHDILHWLKQPSSQRRAEHSAHASECCATLAASFNSYITPGGQKWFRFANADSFSTDKHEVWYSHATDVMLDELARSRFYAEKHEADIDRCLYGTGCLLCDGLRDGKLHYRHIPIGSYGIAENADRAIDTVCRRFEYTAHQAAERFGYDRLPNPVRQAYNNISDRLTKKFEFWHLVTPRAEYTVPNGSANVSPLHMRYASIYLYGAGNHEIVEEGGYLEFPYMVSRFLTWGESVWGYPPAYRCYDDLNRNIKLDRAQDILTDLQIYPRILQAAEQVGQIDFRAGGRTVIDPTLEGPNLPREWLTGGDIKKALERQACIEQRISSAYYVPCLQVINSIDRQMTAEEVRARQEERIVQCSPTYSLYCADLAVIMERSFAILYRAGKFNTAKATQPPELKVPATDGEQFGIAMPKICYHGKINQAIDRAEKQSLDYALSSISSYINLTTDTSCLDNIDADALTRYTLDTTGAPAEIYRTQAEIDTIRTRREEERQAALQLQLAQAANQGAQATKNLAQA